MRGSDFYGIDHTLLQYARLPSLGGFPYAVQNGWQHAATRFEADGHPLEIWAWSDRAREGMAAYFPRDRIRVVGSPYLYLDPIEDEGAAPDRGALYILPHSSHFARIGFSLDDLKSLLADIVAADGSCDVLAYYLDVSDSLCAALGVTRSRVLVNGGLWSTGFMHSFRANIRRYRRVHYSGFGSAVLFARFENRETAYVALESRVLASRNVHLDGLAGAPAYDPVGQVMDTALELGADKRMAREDMRELIRDGWRRASSFRLFAHTGKKLRHRLIDHLMRVRPSLALAAAHNARMERVP
jgi:hypothetical protein